MMTIEPHVIVIIWTVSFLGSYFGSLAGGGGLLVTPVLISFGLPVPVALGTRRFETLGGATTGLIQFHRWKKIDYKFSWSLVAFALTGALVGYIIVDRVNEVVLKKIVGFLIVAMAIVLLFENTEKTRNTRGKLNKYRNIIMPPVTILSGSLAILVGGGGGTILTYLLIIVYGQTVLQSSGNRRLPLLAGHILATILFVWGGYVYYPLAIPLLFANALGGWFGSRFYLKKGEEKVKRFFFIIVIILGIKILFF